MKNCIDGQRDRLVVVTVVLCEWRTWQTIEFFLEAVESFPRTPGNNGRQYRAIPTASFRFVDKKQRYTCFCSPLSACLLFIPLFWFTSFDPYIKILVAVQS